MTECRSPELQDLLPDYVADTLDDLSSARLTAHLAQCAACTEDVAVLRQVRRATPRVAVPDIARIVAALPTGAGPAIGMDDHAHSPRPRLVTDARPTTTPASEARPTSSATRRGAGRHMVFGLPVWRLAATLGVVIAGGTSLLVARRGLVDVQPNGTVLIATDAPIVTPTDSTPVSATVASTEAPESVAVNTPRSAATAVPVSYGDLGDYTEEELQRMLERLEKWDGATSTEPLPGVPLVGTKGGDTL